jgi:hypothetical protein
MLYKLELSLARREVMGKIKLPKPLHWEWLTFTHVSD